MIDIAQVFTVFRGIATKGFDFIAWLSIDQQGTINNFQCFAADTANAFDIIFIGVVAGNTAKLFTNIIGAKHKWITRFGALKMITQTIHEECVAEGDVKTDDRFASFNALIQVPNHAGPADCRLNQIHSVRCEGLGQQFVHIELCRYAQLMRHVANIKRVLIEWRWQHQPLTTFHPLLVNLDSLGSLPHRDRELPVILRVQTLVFST